VESVSEVSEEQQEQAEQVEQQERPEQPMPSETGEPGGSVVPAKKKRVVKKVLKIDEAAISPRPSYWPIVLALALVVLFMGVILNGILLGVGVVLVAIAIFGWSFEHR
jgi:cobalamin biosynthesis Mg chelatase CobN